VLSGYLRERSRKEFLFCASLFRARLWSARGHLRPAWVGERGIRFFPPFPAHPLDELREEFRGPLAEAAETDAEAARVYIIVYSDSRLALYQRHRNSMFSRPAQDVVRTGGYDILLSTIESVASSIARTARGMALSIDLDEAGFIEAVADDILVGELDQADFVADELALSSAERALTSHFSCCGWVGSAAE
jgi:hypothetical protein